MNAQTYTDPAAIERLRAGLCPECGGNSRAHLDDVRFWLPRTCSLLPRGVEDRITWQRHLDAGATS